jgi:hypothetical protein
LSRLTTKLTHAISNQEILMYLLCVQICSGERETSD